MALAPASRPWTLITTVICVLCGVVAVSDARVEFVAWNGGWALHWTERTQIAGDCLVLSGPVSATSNGFRFPGLYFRRDMVGGQTTRYLQVAFWPFFLPPLAVALRLAGRGQLLSTQQRDYTKCEWCGYDLRATPARCPECGAVPGAERPI